MRIQNPSGLLALGGNQNDSSLDPPVKRQRRLFFLARPGVLLAVLFICLAIFTSVSSSSSITSTKQNQGRDKRSNPAQLPTKNESPMIGRHDGVDKTLFTRRLTQPVDLPSTRLLSLFTPQAQGPETIATYADDCLTPKSDFNFGETICAVVSNARLGANERLIWGHTDGFLARETTLNTVTLNDQLTLTPTSVLGGVTVNNRGTWRILIVDTDYAPVASTNFTIHDPATPTGDLAVYKFIQSGESKVSENTDVSFEISVSNYGPDTATNVTLADLTPTATTFVSLTQTSGPAFTCSGSNCSIDTLAKDARANFVAVYHTNGVASETFTSYSASVASNTVGQSLATAELRPADNSASGEFSIVNVGAPQACSLDCPDNLIATANTTVSGQFGAFVTFASAAPTGDCGAITASPASGSFFPAGVNTVTVSSTGGGSCSFTVNVLNTPAPTISCPTSKVFTAASGATDFTATAAQIGTPSFTTANTGTTTFLRSDNVPAGEDANGNPTPPVVHSLTDPYQLGVTSIVWTVTDADGRTASCTQSITVNATCTNDTATPSITAPDDITVHTGADNTGCSISLDDELGQATATDDCSATVTVTGIPSGNNFPIGQTVLTYTATDPAGHTATDTQTITVVDNTLPIIKAPANASYECASSVPAALPSQARGPVLDANGQFVVDANGDLVFSGPPFDNCGSPVVTVTESNNGGAGSAANPLVITRTFKATDASGNFATDVQTITVSDGVAPTITAPADVTAYTGAGATSCDTVVSNGTLGTPTASDNCSVTVTRSPAGNTFPVGTTDVIWTATDPAGNTSTATQHVTVVDNTPPVITPPADVTAYLPLNSTATSLVVNYPNPATATDNCGGTVNITYSPASGSTFSVGTTVVTITATDTHNNQSTATFNVSVLYNFTGFFSPVENLPTLNVVNAGKGVPVKFNLSGNKGLNIFAADSPFTIPINCDGSLPQSEVEETLTAGGSSLSYNATSDQYNYVWKTENPWAGTCRQLVVKLNDGTEHKANFKFR